MIMMMNVFGLQYAIVDEIIIIHTCNVWSIYVGHDYDPDEYPNCGEKYQSPVDIDLRSTVFESKCTDLNFIGYSSTPELQLINKGHTGL